MNIKLNIPEKFFEGEERCGYYVSPEMKKVWAVQLDLLAEFARVCEKHNLRWWIDAGTLLGAVRHKGFIPWDDDVDVMMMRKDYKRLLEVANEFKKPYSLRVFHSQLLLTPFAKLHNENTTMIEADSLNMIKRNIKPDFCLGIYLDVFPFDNLPDDECERKSVCDNFLSLARPLSTVMYYRLMQLTDYYGPARKFGKRCIKAALHYALSSVNPFLGSLKTNLRRRRMEALKEFDNAIDNLNYPDGKWIARLIFAHNPHILHGSIWERSWFDDTVYLPFEMLTLPAPSEYVKVLDTLYGNWHKNVIYVEHGAFYDVEHSYTYYTEEGHMPE